MSPLHLSAIGTRTFCVLFVCWAVIGCRRDPDVGNRSSGLEVDIAHNGPPPSYATCMRDMQGLPKDAARLAIRHGDRRVFIVDRNGYTSHWRVPGIEATDQRGCSTDVATIDHGPFVHSRLLENLFPPDKFMVDADPPYSKCGITRLNWARAYNREIARLTPRSVKKVCGSFKISDRDLGDISAEVYTSYAPANGLSE